MEEEKKEEKKEEVNVFTPFFEWLKQSKKEKEKEVI
jgi:hypothetical protein